MNVKKIHTHTHTVLFSFPCSKFSNVEMDIFHFIFVSLSVKMKTQYTIHSIYIKCCEHFLCHFINFCNAYIAKATTTW